MSQGLQCFNASGQLTFDTAARLGRLIYVGLCSASGVPNGVWTSVVNPAYAGSLWGTIIPNYPIDNTAADKLYIGIGSVFVDVDNQPGKIFISCNDYEFANSTLIYGLY